MNLVASDKRKFEAELPNEIWQSDIMHEPRARTNGVNKKTYLHAILDDHSRFIIHGGNFAEENPISSVKGLGSVN